MISKAIKKYRLENRLTQQELADRAYLNQTTISGLEAEKSWAIEQWQSHPDRFFRLKDLIEEHKKRTEGEPILLFHRSAVPESFNLEADHGMEWVAITPADRLLDCRSLFADRDIAIVVKID